MSVFHSANKPSSRRRCRRSRLVISEQEIKKGAAMMKAETRESEDIDITQAEESGIAAAVGGRLVSGVYEWRMAAGEPTAHDVGTASTPHRREELRLDVDGYYPQMLASGTIYNV